MPADTNKWLQKIRWLKFQKYKFGLYGVILRHSCTFGARYFGMFLRTQAKKFRALFSALKVCVLLHVKNGDFCGYVAMKR